MERTAGHPAGGEELMNMRTESVLIEIPEEAYKQNSVYRPWGEIGQAPSPASNPARVGSSPAPRTVTLTKQKLAINMERTGSPKQKRRTTPSIF